jgi:hypothetical protein
MNRIFRIRTALLAAIVGVVAACDTPVSPSEHPEAGGVVILDASTGSVIAQAIGDAEFPAPLDLAAGATLEVVIKFLDADNPQNLALAFFPDEDESESLQVQIGNQSILAYDDHGDHGDFRALAAGQTTVIFQLHHAGHVEWQSKALTVNVQ